MKRTIVFHHQRFTTRTAKPLLSWRVALLPYLGREELFRQFRLDEPWDSPHNLALADQMPDVYGLPWLVDYRELPNLTCFQVFVGPGAAFEGSTGISSRDFADGVSNTILVGTAEQPVLWTKPVDLEFRADGPLPKLKVLPTGGEGRGFMFFSRTAAWTTLSWTGLVLRRTGGP
jgi:Protein of unknown function (DUF1559)